MEAGYSYLNICFKIQSVPLRKYISHRLYENKWVRCVWKNKTPFCWHWYKIHTNSLRLKISAYWSLRQVVYRQSIGLTVTEKIFHKLFLQLTRGYQISNIIRTEYLIQITCMALRNKDTEENNLGFNMCVPTVTLFLKT